MLTRTVRIQIALFLVIALGGIAYVGVRYVGLQRYLGGSNYTVKVELADAGGIFTNAEVDYRGVPVGRVGDMRLTKDGIEVDLDITPRRTSPPTRKRSSPTARSSASSTSTCARARTSGPYLADGSHIAAKDTELPPPVQDLLLNSDKLVASVPIGSLQTMVNELYNATQGAGADLQQLLVTSKQFFAAATTNLPSTISLARQLARSCSRPSSRSPAPSRRSRQPVPDRRSAALVQRRHQQGDHDRRSRGGPGRRTDQ